MQHLITAELRDVHAVKMRFYADDQLEITAEFLKGSTWRTRANTTSGASRLSSGDEFVVCSFGLFNYDSFVSFRAIGVIWGIRQLTAELMCLLFWSLFLVPTLWGTLLCPLPCYGTDNQRHGNHLCVDCPGVGQVARGLRTL